MWLPSPRLRTCALGVPARSRHEERTVELLLRDGVHDSEKKGLLSQLVARPLKGNQLVGELSSFEPTDDSRVFFFVG